MTKTEYFLNNFKKIINNYIYCFNDYLVNYKSIIKIYIKDTKLYFFYTFNIKINKDIINKIGELETITEYKNNYNTYGFLINNNILVSIYNKDEYLMIYNKHLVLNNYN